MDPKTHKPIDCCGQTRNPEILFTNINESRVSENTVSENLNFDESVVSEPEMEMEKKKNCAWEEDESCYLQNWMDTAEASTIFSWDSLSNLFQ